MNDFIQVLIVFCIFLAFVLVLIFKPGEIKFTFEKTKNAKGKIISISVKNKVQEKKEKEN